jgi:hypothetical protein
MRRDRGLLLNTEIDPCAFYELPDDVQQAAYHVSHFLDHMGVLLSNRLIDLDVLAANIGISAEAAWFKLEPCVRVERERRSTGIYLDYFEHLIASIRTIPIEERYRDLKRLELDPERPKAYL